MSVYISVSSYFPPSRHSSHSLCGTEGGVHPLLHFLEAVAGQQEVQLEGVDLAAALEALVARVVAHVVELVLLEEVRGVGGIALLKNTLRAEVEVTKIYKSWTDTHTERQTPGQRY